ncbi:ABC transporter permease [Acetonema longum]|uniref:Substrate-binding region of ABC-type glycine betaine transport system n=1 Tax=Acetonema longum DSM 6540 TaxID=1009370 RepID=F7NEG5_9FIRM|nr:ABC transporter permease [Acetonema longum]EGO65376.1 substrate-binding region of ABC-type glycine betaine transport system [Acetonema longum DSM 6540]
MDWTTYLTTRSDYLVKTTVDHLTMAAWVIAMAVSAGIVTGIFIAKLSRLAKPVLNLASIIQTIPVLAMFALLMPFVGIGSKAGVIAVTLYSVLPIIQNTYTGITNVDPSFIDAGRGMGMTERDLLIKVELPLAMPVILAGIRTASVLAVAMITLVALIGGSGLGKVIFRGITKVDNTEIMVGAILAAILAILADGILGLAEKKLRWDSAKRVRG